MRTKALPLGLLALTTPLLGAPAQTSPSAAATAPPGPPLSPIEQDIANIKNPVSWMLWGADLRIRDEYFDNILTLNPNNGLHLQDYLRFRGRVWASLTPVEGISLNVRLVDEVRDWLRPAGYTPVKGTSGLDLRDGIVDNLNVQWKNILNLPLTATVGRQDFLPGTPSGLGDGWLVGDGTPFDGSWSYFLDAARLRYDFKEQHTSIQAIGIIQDAHDGGWLPTINNQNLIETEQNEKGAILWVNNSSLPAASVDAFFIYKHDDAISDFPFGSPGAKAYRPDNADIYTMGGRLYGLLGTHWQYSLEGAYQIGQKQDPSIQYPTASLAFRDIHAFGVNNKLDYLFKDSLNNQLHFSYEFLSGDDPKTQDDEMFDNLWGRYPRWSETGLYSYAAETRIGNEANLHRFGPGWSFTPVKDLEFSAAYYALFTPEEVATRGAPGLFTGSGNFRGHFLQTVLRYRFSKHMIGHLWAEFEFPGDYYTYRQTWYFLRPEVTFIF